jgi:hypothetical protein
MKNIIRMFRLGAVALLLFVSATIHAAAPYFFVQQPETQVVEIGTFVAFSARVSLPSGATYQWEFGKDVSGTNLWVSITGATNRDFNIGSPKVDDVGGYRLQAYWGPTNVVSSYAFLSVYELHGTNSTFGTLTTSALACGNQPLPGYSCPYYPAFVFNKYYNPADSAGAFYFFYGPYVAVSAQSGPFVNGGYNRFIEITTGVNNPTPTGIHFYSSFDPPVSPNDCGCESNNSMNLPDLEYYSMSSSSSVRLARYRVSFYYTASTTSPSNLVMNWTYFN